MRKKMDEKEEFMSGGVYYVNSLYQRIVGAVCFSSEKIMEIIKNNIRSNDGSGDNIFPLPPSANILTVGETLFPLIYKIWDHTLNNYHAINLRLQELLRTPNQSIYSNPTLAVLDNLKFSFAQFLSKLYLALDGFDHRRPSAQYLLLLNINEYFLKLKSSIGITHLGSLSFEPLPFEHKKIESGCVDHAEFTHAVHAVFSNLNKLDKYLSLLLTNHHEPKIKSRRWIHYTFGAIGISVLSVWLLRDSRLSGIISNWVLETKDSTVQFLSDNVEQPLTAIRDGLFEAYRNSNKGVIESKQLQATSDLLHGMLLDFSKRTGQKFPPNASDQEMFNIVENSFEEQLRHPIRNLFGGVFAHSMLIHLLKLDLEVEKTIPELNYHLSRATQSKFVILASIPTIVISLGVGILSYALVKQGTRRRNNKERIAQAQRTRLLLNVEKYVKMQNIKLSSQPREDPDYVNGLLLYTLDRLYRAVKKHSKALGDWQADWIRWSDIVFLGKPNAETSLKLRIISHFKTEVPYLFSVESLDA